MAPKYPGIRVSIALIELVHGCGYALCYNALDSLGDFGDGWLEYFLFLRGEVAEHVVDYNVLVGNPGSILSGRAADAYFDSAEILASQG